MNHPKQKSEKKIDEAVDETFPASDPPSYMGSTAVAGGPDDAPKHAEPDRDRVVTERVSIDINKASREEMSALPALSPELVQTLIEHRPFRSWADIEKLSGFGAEKVTALKKGGAHI